MILFSVNDSENVFVCSAKHDAPPVPQAGAGKDKNLKANVSTSQVTQSSSHEGGEKAGRPESRITDRSDTEDHKK